MNMFVISILCVIFAIQISTVVLGDECSEIKCSNVIDYVCGVAERGRIKIIRKYHNICHMNKVKCNLKTIAHVRQVDDSFCNIQRIHQSSGRRLTDFSIMGAHQACNHSCPTYCVDTYEPVCAQMINHCRTYRLVDVRQVDDSFCNIQRIHQSSGRRLTDFSIVGAHQACNHSCPTYCVDTYEPVCAQIWTTPDYFKYRPIVNHCHVDLLSCAAGVNVTIEALGKCFKNPSGLMFMLQLASMKSLHLLDAD